MDRLLPVLLLHALTALCSCFTSTVFAQQAGTARPNIIFIMADDHAYQAVSAYGSRLIQTPNIDRIGREGAIMKNGFVTNSVCSPSRAVILTGKYSHVNGLRDNGTYFNGAQQTLPKILRANGYHTAIVGKWHLWSEPTGFDHWNILPAQGHYYNPPFIKMGKDTAYKGYVTDVITDLALQWIDQHKKGPFFLMLHHKAPHRNFMPPLKYLHKYDNTAFPLPHNFYDDYRNRPALQRQQITVAHDLDIRYDSKIPCDTCAVTKINDWAPAEYQREIERLTAAERRQWDSVYQLEYEQFKKIHDSASLVKFQFRRYMEDYLRCILSVDDNVGRVLDYLDKHGLAENTIVIYTSDQGFYLGEHGLYDKRFMYDESFRTPMVIRYPAKIRPKQQVNAFTLNLDIAPTLLDYAGISIPADMQGASMQPLLQKGKAPGWRKEIYYHYYELSFGLTRHYGIYTGRYKLMHFYNPINAWELYDLKKDKQEMNNLYDNPKYAKIVQQLKTRLRRLQQHYKDDIGTEGYGRR
ncbi:sulfatase family protein [Longitalea arenae]|uniref:sulfatase family protein n=1 Tax=Longitalea arenae TaxID=2812558 RepID=UPI001967DAE3|nr:sulfatase [Longitalea arenae]